MIRRILVPLDGSAYTKSALEVAFRLSAQRDAEVTGIVVLDTPGIERSIGPIPIGGMHYADQIESQRTDAHKKRIKKLLAEFAGACDEAGVRHVEARYQGSPSKWIFREASFYDLVILGMRTHFNFEDPAGKNLADLLELTVTPIVAVPDKTPVFTKDNKSRTVIVMGESPRSIRAIQRFVAVADPEIVDPILFMAHPDERKSEYYLERATNYLTAHGFEPREVISTTEPVVNAMKSRFFGSTDLFVAGSYTMKRFRALNVGNVTRALIDYGETPLFIG